jgi:hypothetical protein
MFNGNVAKAIFPFQSNIFPKVCTVYPPDRGCHTKLHDGGALIAVSEHLLASNLDPYLNIFKNISEWKLLYLKVVSWLLAIIISLLM